MRAAPHLIRPLRFVLPHDSSMRPAWMIRLGLVLYDHLGGPRRLPRSAAVDLRAAPFAGQLHQRFARGFAYSDCWGDDSRLVVANAMDARERGASILTRTRMVGARPRHGGWNVRVRTAGDAEAREVGAKVLVNATGSWAGRVLNDLLERPDVSPLRLVKGSHIVTRRLFEGDHAFVLQNPDRRIVFAIPYEDRFTLIGTTDVDWGGEPDQVGVDDAEVDYLCSSINRYLAAQITAKDVLWRYAGLRPLYDDAANDPSAISRDYVLQVDAAGPASPMLSVFGGKITTHRALAEAAMDKLLPHLPGLGPAWTGRSFLTGGEIPGGDLKRLLAELRQRADFLSPGTARRWVQAYGARAFEVLGEARSLADLGEDFGEGLTEVEVDYLRRDEWAVTAEDILWRRSKLGLHLSPQAAQRLSSWLRTTAGVDGGLGGEMRLRV